MTNNNPTDKKDESKKDDSLKIGVEMGVKDGEEITKEKKSNDAKPVEDQKN